MKLLLILATLIASPAYSWTLISTDRLDLEYTKSDPNNRDSYAPEYTGRWRDKAALQWNISLFDTVFWRNNVHTETIDTGQVKTVGWQWEAGLPLGKYVELLQHHHSRHIMDEEPSKLHLDRQNQFPLENGIMIRVHLVPPRGN